jgi:hypothetical protein
MSAEIHILPATRAGQRALRDSLACGDFWRGADYGCRADETDWDAVAAEAEAYASSRLNDNEGRSDA